MTGEIMWKIAVGFVVFAVVAVWMLSKGGDIDMGGEKHEISVPHTPAATPAIAPGSTPAAPGSSAAAGSASASPALAASKP